MNDISSAQNVRLDSCLLTLDSMLDIICPKPCDTYGLAITADCQIKKGTLILMESMRKNASSYNYFQRSLFVCHISHGWNVWRQVSACSCVWVCVHVYDNDGKNFRQRQRSCQVRSRWTSVLVCMWCWWSKNKAKCSEGNVFYWRCVTPQRPKQSSLTPKPNKNINTRNQMKKLPFDINCDIKSTLWFNRYCDH